jgi:hypothetical protein
VPLAAGVKFTGKAGRTDLGMLDVRTRDVTLSDGRDVDGRNFFVGRVRQNFFQQSYMGLLVTDGNPAAASSARTIGAQPHRHRLRRPQHQ